MAERRAGFALPAVLAVTGVVTLIFLVAITALASLTAEAASARGRVRFLERALTAEATLTYLAATEPMAPQGFSVGAPRRSGDLAASLEESQADVGGVVTLVHLDGRGYAMEARGPLAVALQDQAGLINLAMLDQTQARRLGEMAGLPTRLATDVRALYDDYIDSDGLKTINGAEASEYGGQGPANRVLRRPTEWLSLRGVRAGIDPARWRALRPDLAVDATLRSINLNTATPATLRVLFDLTADEAAAVLRARAQAPFMVPADFMAVSGAVLADEDERLYTFPASRFIFTIRDDRSAWVYRGRVTMTPSGLEQPIWIDQTELTEAPRRARADISDAIRFPYAPG